MVAYCSILGNAGVQQGPAVYPGAQGWWCLWMMQNDSLPEDPDEALCELKSLTCAFDDSKAIRPEERRIIRQLGRRFGAGRDWPSFTSHEPGYALWPLSPAEARFMTVALEQALEAAQRMAEDPQHLMRGPEDCVLVRMPRSRAGASEFKDA